MTDSMDSVSVSVSIYHANLNILIPLKYLQYPLHHDLPFFRFKFQKYNFFLFFNKFMASFHLDPLELLRGPARLIPLGARADPGGLKNSKFSKFSKKIDNRVPRRFRHGPDAR